MNNNMSSESEYMKIDVLEEGTRGTKHHNTYLAKVIKNNDEVLIGIPIKNSNDRVRVEKVKGRVLFYKSEGEYADQMIREETLEEIRDKTPDWLEDYVS